MSIWRWAKWLEPVETCWQVSLGEGSTPLVRSRRIGPSLGLKHLYFKLDYVSPTGSYKDRFAAAAVSHMLARKQTECYATSSGNTGAALAAYCALTGIRCTIAVVETVPPGKLQQMLAYGASIFRIQGFGIDAGISETVMSHIRHLGSQPSGATQISAYSISPLGMSGVETLAFELAEQYPEGMGAVFCQAGGGGLAVALGRGYARLVSLGQIKQSPEIHVVQPEGNDTIASPLRAGESTARNVTCKTQISGLQVPTVIDGTLAIEAARASGGQGHAVTDAAVWAMQDRLALEEGLFCEPAATVPLAGVAQACEQGELDQDAPVVCVLTGSGFKDPVSVERMTANRHAQGVTLEEFRERTIP